ncbi:hypothetical protein [Aestuariimicrobium sp. T2.26MG-19.2B]|uniref:hypothetical protein n=1 Tax=Aestuariimicrobium sp. T2.26MG-19.2B TaxID=3040679 RepID=UPI002477AFA6|nr:hypothetical protein [Aestuariimicrobium sp. T2.26MG-19.2B]CAI9401718.1 hypothetical protein AESSP_00649 [Aestuariimicrobium sp. T2.26MG-19.2B]
MRAQDALRLGYGLAEPAAPRLLEGRLLPTDDARGRTALRVLGARHVVQAAVGAVGGHGVRRLGGLVDVLHAISMIVVATADPARRTAAAANAATALGFAWAELR